jgi:hypothetical protein
MTHMKRPAAKQLRLHTETIRHLEDHQLKAVLGAGESGVNGNSIPFTCNGSCTCHT